MQRQLINFWKWTGFANKNLWDFFPQIIAILTVFAAFSTIKVQQEESKIRYQKEELTKYFNDMNELLLEKEKPLRNQRNNQAQDLMRVKTINTLEQLDENNKRILLNFLIEANLVNNVNNSNFSEQGNFLSGSNSIISLSKANLVKIKLPRVDLSGADLSGADLSGADLSGADLSGADLSGADLSGADLTKARLTKASLRYAELKEAILERTDLTEARLREANLTKANLKDSDLNKASLVGANLEKADLEKANLEKTDLVGAKLNEAKLNEANLRNADLLGTEVAQADFKNVQELNSVKHLSQNQLDSAKNTKDLINSNPQTNLKEQHQEGFSCGPHTRTYAVRSLTKPEIVGVRCLLKTNADTKSNKNKIPNFVWYGEGKFNQKNKKEYRHIGQAFYKDLTLGVGYISELDRYNENKKTLSQSIVKITIVRKEADSVSEFQVKNETGVIEKWTLEEPIKNYTPLIQPTSRFHCGEKFIQYKVYPIVTRRRIINSTSEQSVETDWGLRCVSKHRPHNAITWFGTGQWEGKPYYHLGTKMIVNKDVKKGYGAVDLCGFKQNAYCYKVEGGFLELNPLQDNGFEIKREWSEKWLK